MGWATMPWGIQELFLILCSGIAPGIAWGNHNQWWGSKYINYIKCKLLNSCTLSCSIVLSLYSFTISGHTNPEDQQFNFLWLEQSWNINNSHSMNRGHTHSSITADSPSTLQRLLEKSAAQPGSGPPEGTSVKTMETNLAFSFSGLECTLGHLEQKPPTLAF